jgi:amidase
MRKRWLAALVPLCALPAAIAWRLPGDRAAAETVAPADTIGPRSVEQLRRDLAGGRVTSEELVRYHLSRIGRLDRAGPRLNSVLALNPDAVSQARALDAERRAGRIRGPLDGIPVLVKDNIETADPVPTTAGSLALARNVTRRDAPVAARLRAAGAVILGKANLSEWSNLRSSDPVAGWSAVGGLTRNPYVLDRTAGGSSTGSAVAVAAGLAAAAIGTDTNGSITSPASVSGVVGLRPTLGLVSRRHIVPALSSQDSPGPIALTVRDAALLLGVMAGSDPGDPATREADTRRVDYAGALRADALRGRRLGVMRFAMANYRPEVRAAFARALEAMRAAGAEVVEITGYAVPEELERAAARVAVAEFEAGMNAYLASTPRAVEARTLDELIAFNRRHAERELALFGQEYFEIFASAPATDRQVYLRARERARYLAGPAGIDLLLRAHRLDALIAPTGNPAEALRLRRSERRPEASVSQLSAIAGYPHLTVPMAFVGDLPVGISFVGAAWRDADILALGYAFEQRTKARRDPRFLNVGSHRDTEARR